jgi:hypothetical protein
MNGPSLARCSNVIVSWSGPYSCVFWKIHCVQADCGLMCLKVGYGRSIIVLGGCQSDPHKKNGEKNKTNYNDPSIVVIYERVCCRSK